MTTAARKTAYRSFLLIISFVSFVASANAASRYWVGGLGNWDATTTTHWSASSGGAGGQTVPTQNDDVYFDSNSGTNVIVVITSNVYAKSLTTTTFNGTITNSVYSLFVYGDMTLGPTTTVTTSNDAYWKFNASGTLIQDDAFMDININMEGDSTDTLTFGDNIVLSSVGGYGGNLFLQTGVINANNQNISIGFMACNDSYAGTRTLIMGNGEWTLTNFVWYLGVAPGLTVIADTSTIKLTCSSGAVYFRGGGQTYYDFWDATSDPAEVLIFGSNTFNELKADPGASILFDSSSTQIVSSLTMMGTATDSIFLDGYNGNSWTISKANGIVCCDYIHISNSTATGGAIFNIGLNSSDGGNNSGWNFGGCNPMNIIEQADQHLFSIYPNPTSGSISISMPEGITEITIINPLGQQISKTKVTQKTMDFHFKENGVYIIFIKSNQGTTTHKIVVNR